MTRSDLWMQHAEASFAVYEQTGSDIAETHMWHWLLRWVGAV